MSRAKCNKCAVDYFGAFIKVLQKYYEYCVYREILLRIQGNTEIRLFPSNTLTRHASGSTFVVVKPRPFPVCGQVLS